MMGHRIKQFKLFAPTSLDALVPQDHFYRCLEEKLDLSFVRDLVRDTYGEMGRPSEALAALTALSLRLWRRFSGGFSCSIRREPAFAF